jgi:NTE family protein
MQSIMASLDYNLFQDPTMLTRIPLVGGALSILIHEGLYAGDYFENWIRELLAQKGVYTFKDLVLDEYAHDPKYRYKLQVIASDVSHGKLLVFPRDSSVCGVSPDELEVAKAIRMSMSIPYFFKPIVARSGAQHSYVVDGGLLSNFPVWLLDSDEPDTYWPTIGYKLVDSDANKPHTIDGPISLFKALFDTAMEAHDARYIEDANFVRTVPIPTLGVHTTDFNLDDAAKHALFISGEQTAGTFFDHWNFETYKAKYVGTKSGHRTTRMWKNT